ncbi:MAG: hypothetical protein PHH08_04670 [Candidatus ainarchaeum sp.]|nr:hypothetical protein [Candidatus ainarchaeum sp.]
MSIEAIFLTIALVVFAGFATNIIFKKTRVSDIMPLMIIGAIAGFQTS